MCNIKEKTVLLVVSRSTRTLVFSVKPVSQRLLLNSQDIASVWAEGSVEASTLCWAVWKICTEKALQATYKNEDSPFNRREGKVDKRTDSFLLLVMVVAVVSCLSKETLTFRTISAMGYPCSSIEQVVQHSRDWQHKGVVDDVNRRYRVRKALDGITNFTLRRLSISPLLGEIGHVWRDRGRDLRRFYWHPRNWLQTMN